MNNVAQAMSQRLASKKILVVDDNEMLLKAWDRLLSEEECDYRLTASPEQALEWMRQEKFDILISDIVMPTLDGFDLVRAAWEQNPGMQLVFTTAYSCDFKNAPIANDNQAARDVHVLLKPYQDLGKVEEFIARVLDDDSSLKEVHPLKSNSDLNFHLWHL